MTKWTNEEHTHYTPAQRSFAADMMNLGPASTMGRELLTVIIQTGVVVLLRFVVFPDRLAESWRWLLLAATVIYFAIRFVAGIPKWRRR